MRAEEPQARRRIKVFDETFFKKFRPSKRAAGERKPGPLSYRAQPVNKGPDGHAEVALGLEMGKWPSHPKNPGNKPFL